jgi:DNA-binding transcriptional ArsR family regulator
VADRGETDGKAARGEAQRMSVPLIHALSHPLRRRLLRALNGSSESRSPVQLSRALGADVSSVAYHVHILALQGAVAKMGERQVRGARQTFYGSKISEHEQMVAILADTESDDTSRK